MYILHVEKQIDSQTDRHSIKIFLATTAHNKCSIYQRKTLRAHEICFFKCICSIIKCTPKYNNPPQNYPIPVIFH